jgi:hypothetical protein
MVLTIKISNNQTLWMPLSFREHFSLLLFVNVGVVEDSND